MLRKATADDLPALTALRCGAAKANPVDAAGWLQNVAGLENILVLEKNGQPAAMLAAVPVKYGQHRGVWLCGAAGVQGVPMDRLLPKIMEGCLRAYGASGFDFAVTTPDDARRAEDLKTLGFKSQLPLRVIQTPIRRDLFAQAAFDSLTVHKLLERRHIYQPGCPPGAATGCTLPRATRCNFWNYRPTTTTAPTSFCRPRGKRPVRPTPASCWPRTRRFTSAQAAAAATE